MEQPQIHNLATRCARALQSHLVPLKTEGAGKTGCALHPRSRVQDSRKEYAHEHTGSAESIRPSLRNGFTAYGALSSATNSSCHRRLRIDGPAHPGWARKTSADLASATDAGTTRFYRTQRPPPSAPAGHVPPAEVLAKALKRRSYARRLIAHRPKPALQFRCAPDAAASTASQPAFRDDRDPPLLSGETGGDTPLSCLARQEEYFFGWDWTGIFDLPVALFCRGQVARLRLRERRSSWRWRH